MSRAGAGQSGSFALSLAEFAAQATEAIDASLREIIIEVGNSLIRMSPVGNPEIWAQNAVATQYNKAVDEHNTTLRSDPANLTKAGRLRPGRKVHDGMDIVAPEGYVGGRFRGNWMFSIGAPDSATTEEIDPSGAKSTARITAGTIEFKAGDTCYITNSLGYAIPLEFGHSTQAPGGMVRVTVARFQQIVLEAIRNNQV
ncbi:MAG: Minor tail protein [Pseudomonas fragi]